MAINKTGDAGREHTHDISVHVRDDNNLIDRIHLVIIGTDSDDPDERTNNARIAGWQNIEPVAVVTKAIADAAITTFRASRKTDDNTVDQEIDAIIARKQASTNIDAEIAAGVAGIKTRTKPARLTYSALR